MDTDRHRSFRIWPRHGKRWLPASALFAVQYPGIAHVEQDSRRSNLTAETRRAQSSKAATETAEYAKYAEGGTQAAPFSAYSAVLIIREVARRLRTISTIAVQRRDSGWKSLPRCVSAVRSALRGFAQAATILGDLQGKTCGNMDFVCAFRAFSRLFPDCAFASLFRGSVLPHLVPAMRGCA
jgi:hypothetical protein